MTRRGRQAFALLGAMSAAAMMLLVIPSGRADTIKPDGELTTKEIGTKESQLGQIVADALRETAKSDIAFIAASSFTESVTLSKTKVETADILKALDFKSDAIRVVKLTGAQIRKAMEHSLYLYPKTNSGFLQFSGMKVTVNPDAEKDGRVVSITVDGEPLKNDKTYRVAMPAPLADGALAYSKIWKKNDVDKDADKELKDQTLETAITAFLSSKKTLPKGDERLVIKGK